VWSSLSTRRGTRQECASHVLVRPNTPCNKQTRSLRQTRRLPVHGSGLPLAWVATRARRDSQRGCHEAGHAPYDGHEEQLLNYRSSRSQRLYVDQGSGNAGIVTNSQAMSMRLESWTNPLMARSPIEDLMRAIAENCSIQSDHGLVRGGEEGLARSLTKQMTARGRAAERLYGVPNVSHQQAAPPQVGSKHLPRLVESGLGSKLSRNCSSTCARPYSV